MNNLIEVLVVEDDPRIAEIHRRFAEKIDGFKVIATATTGEQAKEWLEVVQPQLVLLDVYLPDMKGTELVQFIRQHSQEMDIIMITASSEVDVIHKALRGGVVDFIVKPLTFERFRSSLEQYRQRLLQLTETEKLTVDQIEVFWGNTSQTTTEWEEESEVEAIPKGIDPLTLDKVLQFLPKIGEDGMTAGMFSNGVGISPSTARRYLEYLISKKYIYVELTYGTVGRPERRYFRVISK